jgi:predicted 2-oxoglutarate/Fe(II)-dependent dioxygenase YbiX
MPPATGPVRPGRAHSAAERWRVHVEVAPGMYLVRAFDAVEAAAVVSAAAASRAWSAAGINENLDVDRAVRDAEVLFEATAPELLGHCRDRLFAATRDIAAMMAAKTVLAELQIVRYHAGGRYVDHRDTPEIGATPRALSLVCYLNDDFSGGATVFADPEIAIVPERGRVVAFSPVLLHRAEPVTAGTKYVVTAWYHVPPLRMTGIR